MKKKKQKNLPGTGTSSRPWYRSITLHRYWCIIIIKIINKNINDYIEDYPEKCFIKLNSNKRNQKIQKNKEEQDECCEK